MQTKEAINIMATQKPTDQHSRPRAAEQPFIFVPSPQSNTSTAENLRAHRNRSTRLIPKIQSSICKE
ncbi:hypothetical protein BKA69DRAFT_1093150 [Paraphysoderma sedebokerense]|nr:hypothetical protein BKA69DRAFT_1093150 [Paraphysoderma sedebokerense]